MQSVRRLVAILSLVGLSALDSQAVRGQEGGFQVPLNAEPVGPETPGYFTGSTDFIFCSGSSRCRRLARPSLRQPKPGEHLGDYLIAEKLPSQTLPVHEVLLPQTAIPLPPHVETTPVRYFRMGSWPGDCDKPRQPKLGHLPPKPGECLGEYVGEYAIASELPPRYPAPEVRFPTTTVPLPPNPAWPQPPAPLFGAH